MKMKLWQKNAELDAEIEKFTVGDDYLLDKKLVKYDCIASIAHAKMLAKIGILSKEELSSLKEGLNEIVQLHSKDKFEINQEDEDCHTAIENFLVKKCGDAGKKIHAARSRNDQVLAALRLYEKEEIAVIIVLLNEFKSKIKEAIKNYGNTEMPGYSHMQKAMPTTVSIWLGSFIASIEDDLNLLEFTLSLIDQSPLGSAAGFGVPVIEVDKEMAASLAGFRKAMENPLYAQMSRGKFEALIAGALIQIMLSLNKLATDLVLFSMKEFGYVSLPDEFCTGSSIMPQKKNPDVLELVRAKYHIVLGEEFKIKSIISNLMSGYNRDIQLTKEPMMNCIETAKSCIKIMALLMENLKINETKCKEAMTPEIYATEELNKLVKQGVPFREAYKQVGEKYG
ncbi:argininosuccinate lyase [Candidatus Woesearchaeota archaeon]|nr:argininosuccinate lyase [Candidatus Woesearchaeota archaeon]